MARLKLHNVPIFSQQAPHREAAAQRGLTRRTTVGAFATARAVIGEGGPCGRDEVCPVTGELAVLPRCPGGRWAAAGDPQGSRRGASCAQTAFPSLSRLRNSQRCCDSSRRCESSEGNHGLQ